MALSLSTLSRVPGTILILGETGTGKSRLAREIHSLSPRASRPLIEVNLATIAESLIESELFGHVKGAFTGAVSDRRGYCDLVSGGTLFLDEVSELSDSAQKKLLMLLEERCMISVGSCQKKTFDGQVIAASNRSLKDLVAQGKFREDLYYRLRAYSCTLRPLRERPLERDLLMESFFREFSDAFNKRELRWRPEWREALSRYPWPGNIRELRHALEYLVVCEELPEWLQLPEKVLTEAIPEEMPSGYAQAIEQFERSFLSQKLQRNRGRINQTAQDLGLSKVTLIAKVRRYGIDAGAMREEARERAWMRA